MRAYSFTVCPVVETSQALQRIQSVEAEAAALGAVVRKSDQTIQFDFGGVSYLLLLTGDCLGLVVTGHRNWDFAYQGASELLGPSFRISKDPKMQRVLDLSPLVFTGVAVVLVVAVSGMLYRMWSS